MAAAAFVVLVSDPAASQTPSTNAGSRKHRSVAAVAAGQSGDVAALSQAGAKAALRRGAAADQHIRAEPDRRDPDLRQPQRPGRRRYRLRFAQRRRAPNARSPHHRRYSARSCRSRRRRHSRRCRPTTRPSLRHRLRSRSKCRRRRSIRCAPQCGSGQLCRRHRRRCRRSSVNNPPPEVHPLAAANRPGSSLAVARAAILHLRGQQLLAGLCRQPAAAEPATAQYLRARAAAAAPAADPGRA